MKVYLIFGCVLLFVFGSMLTSTLYYKGEFEKCKVVKENLKSLIETQNEAIEKLKVDTEHYTATIALQEQKLKVRYSSIKSDKDLKKCEDKLGEIKNAFLIFNDLKDSK